MSSIPYTNAAVGAWRGPVLSILLFCGVATIVMTSLIFMAIIFLQISVAMLLDGYLAHAIALMCLTVLASVLFAAKASERASDCALSCRKASRRLLGIS